MKEFIYKEKKKVLLAVYLNNIIIERERERERDGRILTKLEACNGEENPHYCIRNLPRKENFNLQHSFSGCFDKEEELFYNMMRCLF